MGFIQGIQVAMNVVGMLTEGYRYVKKHPEEVQQAMDDATKAAAAAKRFAGSAADYLGVDEHMDKAKQAAGRARRMASDATSAIKGGDAKSDAERQLEAEVRTAEMEAAKALAEARQTVLESAAMRTTLTDLVKRLDTKDEAELEESMRVLNSPGVYAIVRYPKRRVGKNLSAYQGVYVDKDLVMGDGIAHAISRAGNPDVYADVKYKQNVVIYLFPCTEEELRYRCWVLTEALGAHLSYNLPVE